MTVAHHAKKTLMDFHPSSSSVLDSRRENENNAVHFLSLWKGLWIVIICNLQYYWNLAVCIYTFLASLIIATRDLPAGSWVDHHVYIYLSKHVYINANQNM